MKGRSGAKAVICSWAMAGIIISTQQRVYVLVSVAELYTRPAYIIPAYRDLSTLWVR